LSDKLCTRIFSELRGKTSTLGVVAANHHERQRYWQFWTELVKPFHGMDAMLTDMSDPNRIDILLGFACRAWAGVEITGTAIQSELAPLSRAFF
jgi:hypothetical protein